MNLSASNLDDPELARKVERLLTRCGVPPRDLELKGTLPGARWPGSGAISLRATSLARPLPADQFQKWLAERGADQSVAHVA